jgi:hypothetical protein
MAASSYRRYVAWLIGGLAAFGGAVATFNFVIDPLQYYRIPTLYKPVFWVGMQRFQVAALSRLYAESVIVVGQSTTENFLPSRIRQSWGRPGSKLSISASTAHEQFLAARLALRTGRVTDVLWGADAVGFNGPANRTNDSQAAFPAHLYQTTWSADLSYLLSGGTSRLSLMILARRALSTDLEHYHTWYDRFEFSRKAVLSTWSRDCSIFRRPYVEDRQARRTLIPVLQASIEHNVANLAREYPNVTFHLFLPPYSMFFYLPAASGWLPLYLDFRTALAQTLRTQPNVRLYDFQIVDSIIENLDNYKDSTHFSLGVSEYIIDAIRDGRHRVRPDDMPGNNRRLIELVNRYDLCRDGRPLE